MPITKATSNVIAPITATGSTTARSLPDRFADVVNVKDFGAKGDGVTDDTAAIQAANNSGAYAITFPAGIYLANNINMNTSWQMADGAFIKYNGSSYSDYIVRCSGNDLFGNLNIDANAASPELMLHVTGTRNTFSRIAVRNLSSVASANVSGAVKISGVGNEIGEIVGRNLLNTGQSNASSPQLLTFAGGSDANIVGSVRGLNVRSGVVCVGTGSNSVQSIDLDGAGDNGIYNTSGKLSVGTIRYKGEDEPIVVIGGDLNIGDAIIDSGFNSAVAVDNCNDVYIGNLIIKDSNIKGLFKNRDVNTCKSLSIGRIMGELTNADSLCYLGRGTTGYLNIGSIDLTYYYKTGQTPSGWADFTSCLGYNIGSVNIRLIDTTSSLTSSDVFRATFPTSPTKLSSFGEFNVSLMQNDGVTLSPAAFFAQNITNLNVNLSKGSMRVDAGPFLQRLTTTTPNDALYANTIPTVGTWKRGQLLLSQFPSIGTTIGWLCTASGTSGTWRPFSYIWTGTVSPEGNLSAPVGTCYINSSGGTSTTFFVKESGTGNVGWTAK